MTLTRYDFTRPPPLAPDLRADLAQWLGRSNALLVELLAGMAVSVELRFEDSLTISLTEALSQWTDKSLAIAVSLAGREETSLIAIPNPLVQELVGGVLGTSPNKIPAERELTPAELAVSEFLVETIVKSLKETWQHRHGLELNIGSAESNLRRTKQFQPTAPLIVCRSIMKTALGESQWCWMFSNEFLARMLNLPERPKQSGGSQGSRRHLERLLLEMYSEMEIRLGEVQLTGPQLAKLRVGDVVVLDQRVTDPLQASVRGEPKFLGWAGRVGNRQAFEIESEIQTRHANDGSDAA